MADPKHEDTSFKVIDRRLFSESGEIRPEVVEQEKREDEAAARKAATQAREAAKTQNHAPQAAGSQASQPASAPHFTGTPAREPLGVGNDLTLEHDGNEMVAGQPQEPLSASSRSFQMLVDFLTRNAAAMLGGMADPRTGQPFVDLEGAREVIDMLDALREKTRGNLSKEDDNLLIEVLGSLKLTFMEISKAAAEQMAKKAKGTK